jgi:transposase-like protein
MTKADMRGNAAGGRQPKRDGGAARPGHATRRTFTAAYKRRIVTEYDGLTEHGARGALLRGEGLYSSHIDTWRRAIGRGELTDSPSALPGSSTAAARENGRLRAENARLTAELAKSEAIVEILGKTYALLEMVSKSAETGPTTSH